MSHKKGIDKKLSVGPAQGSNSQFLNLFGSSISVRLFGVSSYLDASRGKATAFFRRRMCF